jgi:hypothetical protein
MESGSTSGSKGVPSRPHIITSQKMTVLIHTIKCIFKVKIKYRKVKLAFCQNSMHSQYIWTLQPYYAKIIMSKGKTN